MHAISSRKICLIALILCLLVFTGSYWVQYKYGLAPCPLCMLQRIAMIAVAILMFIGLLHGPKRSGSIAYGCLGLIFSALGLALAGRQIWLQAQGPSSSATCLPGLPYLFNTLPFGQALKEILHGSSECSRVRWHLLGLSLPEWAAITFVILIILMLILIFKKHRSQQNA